MNSFLSLFDPTSNWPHMLFVLLCLTSSAKYDHLQCSHVAVIGMISSFYMADLYRIVYTHRIFVSHSSVEGRLGCFRVLAIVCRAARHVGVHMPF